MKRYYIAYGSNMHLEQMSCRCPNATVHATGILKDWRLVFRGSKTCAYATLEKCSGHSVPIVIWSITPLCERSLDVYEGYPNFYYKKELTVETDSRTLTGVAYVMNRNCKAGKPSITYMETIWQGYIDNNLDTVPLAEAVAYNRIECR